jgi:hypothetical protein
VNWTKLNRPQNISLATNNSAKMVSIGYYKYQTYTDPVLFQQADELSITYGWLCGTKTRGVYVHADVHA